MPKLRLFALLLPTLLLALSAVAEPTHRRTPAPQFTSVYTDMNRDCKSALTKKEEREAEARGTDVPMRCKGYGGYYIYIYYSAMAAHWNIQLQGQKDVSIGLGSHPINYSDAKGRKVEWRMADGKPFAVIMRVNKYSGETGQYGSPFEDRFKTGEALMVRGLKGYERIEGEVDAKSPEANKKARQIADEGFQKK